VTADQYRSALDRLGLSYAEAARVLACDRRTALRYAAGDSEVPELTARVLRLILAGRLKVRDVEAA
jgi:hypothetical protein